MTNPIDRAVGGLLDRILAPWRPVIDVELTPTIVAFRYRASYFTVEPVVYVDEHDGSNLGFGLSPRTIEGTARPVFPPDGSEPTAELLGALMVHGIEHMLGRLFLKPVVRLWSRDATLSTRGPSLVDACQDYFRGRIAFEWVEWCVSR